MLFTAPWMDLEIIILSKVSQTEKDKYMWNRKEKKKTQMNLFPKQEETHRHRKLMITKGERGEG